MDDLSSESIHGSNGLIELVNLSQKLPFLIELSVGSAIYPDDGITLDSLVQIADQSMYRQKVSKKY